MSIGSKFKSFFALDEEVEYVETAQEEKIAEIPIKTAQKQNQQQTGPQNVVSLKKIKKSSTKYIPYNNTNKTTENNFNFNK